MHVAPYDTSRLVTHIHFVLNKNTYPGWKDIRNHVHVHSMYWVHEGQGTFITNTEHEVNAGMLVYLKPGLEMSMRSHPQAPLRMTMILFECAEVSYNFVWGEPVPIRKLRLPFLTQYNASQAEEISALFRLVRDEWDCSMTSGATVATFQLQILLHKLHMMEQFNWKLADSGAFAAFEQIKAHVEGRYKEAMKIEALAEQHSISASYLRKLFLKYTGMGPKEYLNAVRMQHACGYLQYTDYPIKEIGKLCGYPEEFHFSKMFKQMKGISPSSYRKEQSLDKHKEHEV